MGELVLNPATISLWTARAPGTAALTGIMGTTTQSGPTTMKAGELHRSAFGNGIEESRGPWRVVSQPPRRNHLVFIGIMAASSPSAWARRREGQKNSRQAPTGLGRLGRDPLQSAAVQQADAESSNRRGGGRVAVQDCGRRRNQVKLGHCANPAALEAWKGYEWAKALDKGALYATKENAAMMAKYIKEHASDGYSCLFLSLLAFSTKPIGFFDQKWGEVTIERLDSVIGRYAREARTAITIYLLCKDGRLRGQQVFGRGSDHGGAIAIIPAGNGAIHALPIAQPSGEAIVVPEAVLRDITGDAAPREQAAATAEAPEPAPDRTGAAASPEPESERKRHGPQGPQDYRLIPACDPPNVVGPFLWPPKSGKYVGPSPPPKWFTGDWVAGYLASERRDVSMMRQWLYTNVLRPDLASATLGNFRRFGTTVYYSDVNFGSTVARIGRRSFTDGQTEDEFFTAGDRLTADGYSWDVLRVTWDGHPVLVAKPCSISTIILAEPADAKVHPALGEVDEVELFKARCTAMRLTRSDPIETALATRWMGDWAAKGYDVKGDPDDVASLASAVARQYCSVGSVGGGYGWGLCYSCGGKLTGKSRICCWGVNRPLAKIIAAGEKVTSLTNRILYPGVVWCTSQHPPLKAGVETVATDQNFQ